MNPSRALPSAVLFDMDGVITDTAAVHAVAWKRLFDDALLREGIDVEPFDAVEDYRAHVDGKAREQGVRSYLAARGVDIAEGTPEDAPGTFTVYGLAAEKQHHFDRELSVGGVRVFDDAVTLIRQLRDADVPVGLVTSSRNSVTVLNKAGLLDLFDVRVDGNTAIERNLPGKPRPDLFLHAAEQLSADPVATVVFEDARSGVEAAFAGRFGLIVGVARDGADGHDLWEAGADRVLRTIGTIDLTLGWDKSKGPRPDPHLLAFDDYDPENERHREALFGTGNGYWGSRASLPGTVDDGVHYPGTYLAGVYNRVQTDLTDTAGIIAETEHIINAPDWTYLRVTDKQGHRLLPSDDTLLDYRQELSMDTGISRRIIRRRDAEDRVTTVTVEQLQSMSDAHTAALRVIVHPENWSGAITVVSAVNGDVRNRNVTDDHSLETRHLSTPVKHHLDGRTVLLETQTKQSDVDIAIATRTTVRPSFGAPVNGTEADDAWLVGQSFTVDAMAGRDVVIEKLASAATSRDRALSTPLRDAEKHIMRMPDYEELVSAHSRRWERHWKVFGMKLPTGRTDALALSFNAFHVLQNTALVNRDLDAGTPARGLYGEGYRGHIFWDEIFVYPMLTMRQPALTRALLLYRYRRLDEARQMADQEGLRGARFPWQSGSDGREETPSQLYNPMNGEWMADNSHHQYHVGLDAAYSVWQYYQVTGDLAFLTDVGAELLIEVARMFASKATYDPETDRYSIAGVMGPDEFHDGYPDAPGEGLRDNAYTNVLASWALSRARIALGHLDPHVAASLRDQLGLTHAEIEEWDHIARRLRLVFHEDGVLSQFDGYEDLKEFDWEGYKEKYGDIGRLDLILGSEGDSPNAYKVSKQADTVMLFYLFSADELGALLARMGYRMSRDEVARTINYYYDRSSHGSTLSEFVHAWAFSRCDLDKSWRMYQDALLADLENSKGSSTGEGIHLGVMAGTVDMLIRAYSGLQIRGDDLVLDPNVPSAVPELEFQIHFRGQPVQIIVEQDEVSLELHRGSQLPLNVVVRGVHRKLNPGERWVAPLPLRE